MRAKDKPTLLDRELGLAKRSLKRISATPIEKNGIPSLMYKAGILIAQRQIEQGGLTAARIAISRRIVRERSLLDNMAIQNLTEALIRPINKQHAAFYYGVDVLLYLEELERKWEKYADRRDWDERMEVRREVEFYLTGDQNAVGNKDPRGRLVEMLEEA